MLALSSFSAKPMAQRPTIQRTKAPTILVPMSTA
jgi:hypothetical protein